MNLARPRRVTSLTLIGALIVLLAIQYGIDALWRGIVPTAPPATSSAIVSIAFSVIWLGPLGLWITLLNGTHTPRGTTIGTKPLASLPIGGLHRGQNRLENPRS